MYQEIRIILWEMLKNNIIKRVNKLTIEHSESIHALMVSQYQGVTTLFTIHVADAMDTLLCTG